MPHIFTPSFQSERDPALATFKTLHLRITKHHNFGPDEFNRTVPIKTHRWLVTPLLVDQFID